MSRMNQSASYSRELQPDSSSGGPGLPGLQQRPGHSTVKRIWVRLSGARRYAVLIGAALALYGLCVFLLVPKRTTFGLLQEEFALAYCGKGDAAFDVQDVSNCTLSLGVSSDGGLADGTGLADGAALHMGSFLSKWIGVPILLSGLIVVGAAFMPKSCMRWPVVCCQFGLTCAVVFVLAQAMLVGVGVAAVALGMSSGDALGSLDTWANSTMFIPTTNLTNAVVVSGKGIFVDALEERVDASEADREKASVTMTAEEERTRFALPAKFVVKEMYYALSDYILVDDAEKRRLSNLSCESISPIAVTTKGICTTKQRVGVKMRDSNMLKFFTTFSQVLTGHTAEDRCSMETTLRCRGFDAGDCLQDGPCSANALHADGVDKTNMRCNCPACAGRAADWAPRACYEVLVERLGMIGRALDAVTPTPQFLSECLLTIGSMCAATGLLLFGK